MLLLSFTFVYLAMSVAVIMMVASTKYCASRVVVSLKSDKLDLLESSKLMSMLAESYSVFWGSKIMPSIDLNALIMGALLI